MYNVPQHMMEYLPFTSLLSRPLRTLAAAALVLACAVCLGLLLPAYLFHLSGTLVKQDIVNRLPKDVKPKWDDYTATVRTLQDSIHTIDSRLAHHANTATPGELAALTDVRTRLQSALDAVQAKPPIRIVAYLLEPLMFVWPAFYVCIGWLVILLPPRCCFIGLRYCFLIFICILITYRWPTWIRNSPPLRTEARVVYANGNIDVSEPSFFVQEFQAVIGCALLTALWARWVGFLQFWRGYICRQWSAIASGKKLPDFLEHLAALFIHWQICSVVLAGAFLPYTFFFWRFVIGYGDQRYLAHAVIIHALWGASWLLISMPVAWTWYQWSVRYRLHLPLQNSQLVSSDAPVAYSPGNDLAAPVGTLNVIGSLAGAILTFGLPVFKEILTRI